MEREVKRMKREAGLGTMLPGKETSAPLNAHLKVEGCENSLTRVESPLDWCLMVTVRLSTALAGKASSSCEEWRY